MKTPILQMTGISAAYDNKTVLENINLTVFERDFLGVIGPNGGGKTTLIKVMLGLLNPTAGKVTFYQEGKEVPEISMGYLPQYNSIDKKFPISVYEVVLSGLNRQKSLFRSFSPAQHEQVKQVIARMGLEGLEKRAIGQLSGGQLQRALLGRALVSNPQVLILDEPSSALDPIAENKMFEAIFDSFRDKTVIYILHRLSSATFADRIYLLENGQIAEQGTHAELIALNGKYADMFHKQAEKYIS